MRDANIGQKHGELTIISRSSKEPNGYLNYYWTRCSCGNIKRYRYDQARRKGSCGMCEDFRGSNVLEVLKEMGDGEKD